MGPLPSQATTKEGDSSVTLRRGLAAPFEDGRWSHEPRPAGGLEKLEKARKWTLH